MVARYITERCNLKGKVRNLILVSGPVAGVAEFPIMWVPNWVRPLLNYAMKKIYWTWPIQHSVGP